MFSVLYDFSNLLSGPVFRPHLRVGVRYQWARMSGVHVNGTPTGFPALSDTMGAIAYQFILGGAMPIPSVLGNRRSRRSRRAGRIKLDNDFNHAVLIGLRYNFLPPPPPPPVALLLRPLRRRLGRILSCFDWDKATLTDRARQIIREAADNSMKVPYTRIEVNGYTDTSGTTHTTRAYRCVRPNWCGKGCRNKRSPSRFWRYEFAGADGSRCA
jgi:OmpA-OmpF porin, OOP family